MIIGFVDFIFVLFCSICGLIVEAGIFGGYIWLYTICIWYISELVVVAGDLDDVSGWHMNV